MSWAAFWQRYPKKSGEDLYKQVGKTAGRKPITATQLQSSIDDIVRNLELNKGDTLLDLCCGNGLLTCQLAQKCKEVLGIDFSVPLIEQAKAQCSRPNLRYRLLDIRQLAALEGDYAGYFDKILLNEAVAYLEEEELRSVLLQALRLSKPSVIIMVGGILDDRLKWQLFNTWRRAAVCRPLDTKPNLRVLHVCTVPQMLVFLTHQATYVRAQGAEVHAVASPRKELGLFATDTGATVHAVEISRQITPLSDLRSLWHLFHLLRRLRPDVVHGHTPKGGLLAMIAGWLCRVPVRVYHLHGLPLVTATGLRRWLLRWCERVSCRLAHQVFCVSPSLRALALAEGLGGPEKLAVLLNGSINGVDAEGAFNPARLPAGTRETIRAEHGIPAAAPVIGFVGRLVRDKGVVELAEAWKTLRAEYPELHLLLVGPAETHDPPPGEIEQLLRTDDRVHWTGDVEMVNMPRLYPAMDLLVLPTYREGFGAVLLEAAAMELPVAATRIPGCVDAVQDGETGTLVPPGDAGALAQAVRTYLEDSALRRRHGQAGRARALRDFRPQDLSEAIYREYLRLLRNRGIQGSQAPTRQAGCTEDDAKDGSGRLTA